MNERLFASTRTVKAVPTDINTSGWYALLPPPPSPRVLQGEHRADWLIIGAGFAGLFAARRLRQLRPNDKIVVLDAQRIAFGAAGRNSGFMIDLPHELNSDSYAGANEADLKQITMNRAGIAIAREAAKDANLQSAFNPCGKYHGAAGAKGIAALASFESHLKALGEAHTSLSAVDMQRITGTNYYVGGTFTPGAVILQPAAFIRGLAQHLSQTVEIFENSPVLRIDHGTDHVATTAQGTVRAPRIILATNGHLQSFGFFQRRLMHVFTYASMTRQLTDKELSSLGGQPDWALIPADPMGTTVRRLREGRIVVRNTFTYNPNLSTTSAQVASMAPAHDKSFAARFAMLAGVTMQHRWGGHLCLSLNSVSAFGEVADRVFAAGCCNGLGTVKSTLAGTLAAELACGEGSDLLSSQLAEAAPKQLYPEPFMTLGAKAKMWWMQKRAGADL